MTGVESICFDKGLMQKNVSLKTLQWLIDKINSFNKTKSSCNSISWHLHVLMDLLLSSQ